MVHLPAVSLHSRKKKSIRTIRFLKAAAGRQELPASIQPKEYASRRKSNAGFLQTMHTAYLQSTERKAAAIMQQER